MKSVYSGPKCKRWLSDFIGCASYLTSLSQFDPEVIHKNGKVQELPVSVLLLASSLCILWQSSMPLLIWRESDKRDEKSFL